MKPQTPDNPIESLDPELKRRLDVLQTSAERTPQNTARGRAKYLFQAQEMRQAVSNRAQSRHKGWIALPNLGKKEPVRMSTLATILIIFSLVFGGSTATVAAAQSALPDQPLYSLKLTSEEVQAQLTTRIQSRFELALQLSDRRLGELEKMMLKGVTLPDALLTRYQNQMQTAFRLAAGMSDEDITPALLRLQETLRQQEQIMLRLHDMRPDSPLLYQFMAMIQTRLHLAAGGLEDPLEFRNQVRTGQAEDFTPPQGEGAGPGVGNQYGGYPWTEEPPAPGYGEGNGNPWTDESPVPGSGFGQEGGNPWTDDTPTPGSGYGEGSGSNPWTSETPTPGSGYGEGNGSNPWTSETPTPGSGYGPGQNN